jgi:hypothetical protein
MIVPDSYAWSSPYVNARVERLYGRHFRDLYGRPVETEAQFQQRLTERAEWPEIMLIGNLSRDRATIAALSRERGINVAHWEDGFFPHYETMHADPLGFSWESSLPRMFFRVCSDRQRARARAVREAWLQRPARELPPGIKKPFVFWPLQLLGDQVNEHDLNVRDWTGLLRHFRACLPKHFQLVIKDHPRAFDRDMAGLDALLPELPHTLRLPREAELPSLLRACHAVAGANSSLLYEARLMHHKPAYAYGRSWFTNHHELFLPLRPPPLAEVRSLPRPEWLENPSLLRTERLDDYTDWFLAQLLARQIDTRRFTEPHQFKDAVWRLSYQSFLAEGEAIFDQ